MASLLASGLAAWPLTVLAVLLWPGEPATARPASARQKPSQSVIRHDEGVVNRMLGDCRAFELHGCPFGDTSWTSDGHGQLLYAIDLRKTAGDSCGLGEIYFFEVKRLITTTAKLAPRAAVTYSMRAVTSPGPLRFAVYYAVNPSKNAFCYQFGSAGTDPYVYRWTGRKLVLVSGKPPRPPQVLTP